MVTSNEKYDIIVLAGQSNAEGWGFGDTDNEWKEDERIDMFRDKHPVGYVKDENGVDVLDLKYPLDFEILPASEGVGGDGKKVGNLAIWFAKEYADKYLEKGRKILIVKTAIGGSGFKRKQWCVGDCLQVRMEVMANTALKMNKENKIVAFLWHQGEFDGHILEKGNFDTIKRGDYYEREFTRLVKHFRKRFKAVNVPIITGGFVDEIKKEQYGYKGLFDVENALKDVAKKEPKMAFVDASGLRANKNAFEGGDEWHFCRKDLEILGKRYFKAYEEIKG